MKFISAHFPCEMNRTKRRSDNDINTYLLIVCYLFLPSGGPGTKKAPMIHRRIKEAPKGRFYIAKQNYSAQEVGELSLHKGDHVEGEDMNIKRFL